MEVYFKRSKTVLEILLCLTYAGLFLPIRFGNVLFIILLVFCVLTLRMRETIAIVKTNTGAQYLILIFLLYVIGLLYTSNLKLGLFVLEKKLAFLLFPILVLPAVVRENIDIRKLLGYLGMITMGSSVILLCIAIYKYQFLHDKDAFFYENFSSIHYVFYALYFSCGVCFVLDILYEKLSGAKKVIVLSLFFVYALVVLTVVASKTGLLIFIFVTCIFLYIKVPNRKFFWLCMISLVVSSAALIYVNKTLLNRFTELSNYLSVLTQEGPIKDIEVTDLNMRLLFWKISILHSWRDHVWITGVGPGDAQQYLDSLYVLPEYMLYGYVGWDSHNQWVFSFIQLGLAGVISLGLFYGTFFTVAIGSRNFQMISFLVITLAFSFSESILESNKGIMFFCMIMIFISIPARKTL